MGNKCFFVEFSPIATIKVSTNSEALIMAFSCPEVIGSKDPGNIPILFFTVYFKKRKVNITIRSLFNKVSGFLKICISAMFNDE